MEQVYPVFICYMNDESEHPYLACVPDMDILTEGDSFADAIKMARDAIGLTGISMEDHQEKLPEPSSQSAAIEKARQNAGEIDFSKGTLTYVDIDFTEYRKQTETKTVLRNVSLPDWLSHEAEHAGINISKVLQDALVNLLHAKQNL